MAKKKRRKRSPRRMSILTLVGLGFGVAGSMNDRTPIAKSVYNAVTNPDWGWDNAMADVLVQTIGYDPRSKDWRVPTLTASLLIGSVGSKVLGKFVKPSTFDAIPYIGKKIKL